MPPPQRRRRQVGSPRGVNHHRSANDNQVAEDDEDQEMEQQRPESPEDVGSNGDEPMGGVERDETSQLIKKLVRYALACEYSRTPIRRDGVKEKGTRRALGSRSRL
jgi:MAGE family